MSNEEKKHVVSLAPMGDINKMRPLIYKHIKHGQETSEKRIPVGMFKMIEKLAPVMKNDPKTQANARFLMESLMLPRHNLVCIYLLMKEVDEFMTRHNIRYWADGGTTLAMARDHQQIPYDDDVDICVFRDGFDKCVQYLSEFEKIGYSISRSPSMLKISTAHNWARSVSRTFGCVTLDIFCYKKQKGEVFLENPALRARYPGSLYKCKELFPIIRHKYGPVTFMGANNPSGYCDRLYPGWRKTSVIELRDSPTISATNIKSETISLPYAFVMKYAPKYNITLQELNDVREAIDKKIKFASMIVERTLMGALTNQLKDSNTIDIPDTKDGGSQETAGLGNVGRNNGDTDAGTARRETTVQPLSETECEREETDKHTTSDIGSGICRMHGTNEDRRTAEQSKDDTSGSSQHDKNFDTSGSKTSGPENQRMH